jgi:hypothetical protein
MGVTILRFGFTVYLETWGIVEFQLELGLLSLFSSHYWDFVVTLVILELITAGILEFLLGLNHFRRVTIELRSYFRNFIVII